MITPMQRAYSAWALSVIFCLALSDFFSLLTLLLRCPLDVCWATLRGMLFGPLGQLAGGALIWSLTPAEVRRELDGFRWQVTRRCR